MWIQQLEGGDAQEHNVFIQFLQVDESCDTTYNMNKDDMICVADDMCITLKSMDDLIDNIYEKLEQRHVEINYIVNKNY
jgi:hypothetical protein